MSDWVFDVDLKVIPETDEASAAFIDLFNQLAKKTQHATEQAGGIFNSKILKKELDNFQRDLELFGKKGGLGGALPKNDIQLQKALEGARELTKTLSAPVGEGLLKTLTSIVKMSRPLEKAFNPKADLNQLISQLDKATSSMDAYTRAVQNINKYTQIAAAKPLPPIAPPQDPGEEPFPADHWGKRFRNKQAYYKRLPGKKEIYESEVTNQRIQQSGKVWKVYDLAEYNKTKAKGQPNAPSAPTHGQAQDIAMDLAAPVFEKINNQWKKAFEEYTYYQKNPKYLEQENRLRQAKHQRAIEEKFSRIQSFAPNELLGDLSSIPTRTVTANDPFNPAHWANLPKKEVTPTEVAKPAVPVIEPVQGPAEPVKQLEKDLDKDLKKRQAEQRKSLAIAKANAEKFALENNYTKAQFAELLEKIAISEEDLPKEFAQHQARIAKLRYVKPKAEKPSDADKEEKDPSKYHYQREMARYKRAAKRATSTSDNLLYRTNEMLMHPQITGQEEQEKLLIQREALLTKVLNEQNKALDADIDEGKEQLSNAEKARKKKWAPKVSSLQKDLKKIDEAAATEKALLAEVDALIKRGPVFPGVTEEDLAPARQASEDRKAAKAAKDRKENIQAARARKEEALQAKADQRIDILPLAQKEIAENKKILEENRKRLEKAREKAATYEDRLAAEKEAWELDPAHKKAVADAAKYQAEQDKATAARQKRYEEMKKAADAKKAAWLDKVLAEEKKDDERRANRGAEDLARERRIDTLRKKGEDLALDSQLMGKKWAKDPNAPTREQQRIQAQKEEDVKSQEAANKKFLAEQKALFKNKYTVLKNEADDLREAELENLAKKQEEAPDPAHEYAGKRAAVLKAYADKIANYSSGQGGGLEDITNSLGGTSIDDLLGAKDLQKVKRDFAKATKAAKKEEDKSAAPDPALKYIQEDFVGLRKNRVLGLDTKLYMDRLETEFAKNPALFKPKEAKYLEDTQLRIQRENARKDKKNKELEAKKLPPEVVKGQEALSAYRLQKIEGFASEGDRLRAITKLYDEEILTKKQSIAILKEKVNLEKKILDEAVKLKNTTIKDANQERIRKQVFDVQQGRHLGSTKEDQIAGYQDIIANEKLTKKQEQLLVDRVNRLTGQIAKENKKQEQSDIAASRKVDIEKTRAKLDATTLALKKGEINKAEAAAKYQDTLRTGTFTPKARASYEQRAADLNSQYLKAQERDARRSSVSGSSLVDAFNFLAFSQLANATTSLTKSMVGAAGAIEQYKRRIEVVLKNSKESNKYFDFLLEYEKITPFDINEVMTVGAAFAAQQKTLGRVGETKESAVRLAGELGSINPSAGIVEAQRAISRVAAGDSNGLEILRSQFGITNENLAEGGVRLTKQGVPLQSLRAKQAVIDALNKYVTDITGGIGAENLSTTLTGKLSTLGSQWFKTMAKIMEPLIPFLTATASGLTRLLEVIEKLPEGLRAAIGVMNLFMSSIVGIASVGAMASWGGKVIGLRSAAKVGGALLGSGTAGAISGEVVAGATGAASVGLIPKLVGKAQGAIKLLSKIIVGAFELIMVGVLNMSFEAAAAIGATVAATALGAAALAFGAYKWYQADKLSRNNPMTKGRTAFTEDLVGQQKDTMAEYGSSDDTFLSQYKDVTGLDSYNLDDQETKNANLKRIDKMLAQSAKNIEKSTALYGEEGESVKRLKEKHGLILEARQKQLGFLNLNLDIMKEEMNQKVHDRSVGKTSGADVAQMARQNLQKINQELNYAKQATAANATEQFLGAEDRDKLAKAKKTLEDLRPKRSENRLNTNEKKDWEEAFAVRKELTEKAGVTTTNNIRDLNLAKNEAESTLKQAALDEVIAKMDRIADLTLQSKDSRGRASAEDKINNLIAKASNINRNTEEGMQQGTAADYGIVAAKREKWQAENKRRMDGVRILKGEEIARLREINIEEKKEMIAVTGYAEDKNTRLKAFAKERATLEAKAAKALADKKAVDGLAGLIPGGQASNMAKKAQDDRTAALAGLNDLNKREQEFVAAQEGNEDQVHQIRLAYNQKRLDLARETAARLRDLEKQNLDAMISLHRSHNETLASIEKARIDRKIQDQSTETDILKTNLSNLSPGKKLEQQDLIRQKERESYLGAERESLDEGVRAINEKLKSDLEQAKADGKAEIAKAQAELNKFPKEGNAKERKLRQEALYAAQNKAKQAPEDLKAKAESDRKDLINSYNSKGKKLEAEQKVGASDDLRTKALSDIQMQIKNMEAAKQELEYAATRHPETRTRFQKIENLQERFKAEKAILDLKHKAETDDKLNPNLDPATVAAAEKAHKIDTLSLQRKYLDMVKEVTSELDKQANIERQSRIDALQASLAKQQKDQGLEGFTMGGTYTLEEMQQRTRDESELFRLKAGFGMKKTVGADHGAAAKTQYDQGHGGKGPVFEGMFGDLNDTEIGKSGTFERAFDYANIQKQGFRMKNGELQNMNPSKFVPKAEVHIIVDSQENGKTKQSISKTVPLDWEGPKNPRVRQGGK